MPRSGTPNRTDGGLQDEAARLQLAVASVLAHPEGYYTALRPLTGAAKYAWGARAR